MGLGIGMRRGSRGRMPSAAPPPLLEGQTLTRAPAAGAATAAPVPVVPSAPAPGATQVSTPAAAAVAAGGEIAAPPVAAKQRRGRRGARDSEPAAAVKTEPAAQQPAPVSSKQQAPAPAPAAAAPATPARKPAEAPAARGRRAGGRQGAEATPAAPALPDLKSLGLPTERDEVIAYLREYDGVGPKSVQSLVAAFGGSGVFRALRDDPERVKEVVGAMRGERLLQAWHHDYQRRIKAHAKKPAAASGTRGRRGGRGGKKRAPKGA